MKQMIIRIKPVPKESVRAVLEANGIRINRYAEEYFAHPGFVTEDWPPNVRVVILSPSELGFTEAASFGDITQRAIAAGYRLCRPATGFYLRLQFRDQEQSRNSVLTGLHQSPDRAVTVATAPLNPDDAFPKGLYLRNLEGTLWLRGYRCDASYLWSEDDLFAFEM